MIKLVVGIGNIGEKYEKTVHNMGFMVADAVANELGKTFNVKECNAIVSKSFVNGEILLIAKPTTYMNESGIAVKGLKNKYKIKPEEIVVISDDIDLDPGKIRIRENGSAGTHNGLKSIIHELGCDNFKRVRVGVGRPPEYMDLVDFVLSKARMTDEQILGLDKAKNAVLDLIHGDEMQIVMGRYN